MKNRIINLFDYMADREYVADYGSPEDLYRETVKFFLDPETIKQMKTNFTNTHFKED